MSLDAWFTIFVLLVAAERVAELVISGRNIARAKSAGAVERGFNHYPYMVLLHMGLLVGCLVEVWTRHPSVNAWFGWLMVGLVVASQALRWWCITTLGRYWNTRIVVLPGVDLIRRGPYSVLRHPNYVAVVLEGCALPLVRGAWLTATTFTIANACLLWVRISAENQALAELATPRVAVKP